MSINIINMIPNSMSGEIERDSEPDITINPANPLQIAASAFGPFSGPATAPIFVSIDGGDHWSQNLMLPGGSKTNDTSMRFGGNTSVLYMGILRTDNGNLNILRTGNFLGAGPADILVDRSGEDQPFIQCVTSLEWPVNQDRLYVGHNDFNSGSATASVDLSQNAATAPAPAGITTAGLDERTTTGQDGPSIRPAVHLDGTVYAAFIGFRSGGNDVVVVRDDNWASGATKFKDLVSTVDMKAGVQIATGLSMSAGSLGTQRVLSQLSIAVDPRNSQTVYVAWCDGASAATWNVHLYKSTTGGQTWTNIHNATTATNPAVAVNSRGKVALLYQQLGNPGTGNRWRTHVELSTDDFATTNNLLLADVPDQNGSYGGINPIGDYDNLIAFGKDFYGIFSANNTPSNANFPNGVTYRRNANFATNTLLNTDGVTPVAVSIDPFFFHWTEVEPNKDFYVRDWTNSATDHDLGQEPSTFPWFYAQSDVWNSNTNAPGVIASDWYQGDDPTAGTGAAGDNFAFARISRNDSSTAESVDVEFLFSDYGLGVPYASVGSQTISFAVGDSSKITGGQPWHVDLTASTHVCLAAQLNSADDPLLAPGLNGYVPGWPYPDLMVIDDNNKAQRNLHVIYVMSDMDGVAMMRVRNAANYMRDMTVGYDAPGIREQLPRSVVEVTGGESKAFKPGDSIVLANMKPGENRWVTFNFRAVNALKNAEIAVNFYELNGKNIVNGCTVTLKTGSASQVIKSILSLQYSVFKRLDALGHEVDKELIGQIAKILESRSISRSYASHAAALYDAAVDILKKIAPDCEDKRAIERDLKTFSSKLPESAAKRYAAHTTVLKKLDAYITMNNIAKGDTACILSNVNMQLYLYRSHEKLMRLKATAPMLTAADKFVKQYAKGAVTNKNYPALVKDSLHAFKEAAEAFTEIDEALEEKIRRIEESTDSLQSLQKSHYELLLLLSDFLNR